jgi:predicted RNase H-like nuclease
MSLDLSDAERGLLTKVMSSYLSELRQTIAASKGNAELHAEEDQINALMAKLTATGTRQTDRGTASDTSADTRGHS